MFGDTVTRGQKGSDAYLTDRAEVAAKEKVYKDKVNSIEFNTRGRDTLLRSGKVVGKNEPQAMYNREQEETGYIGTDSEGYGVGMIAGPGQAGVVVDADGKIVVPFTLEKKWMSTDNKHPYFYAGIEKESGSWLSIEKDSLMLRGYMEGEVLEDNVNILSFYKKYTILLIIQEE